MIGTSTAAGLIGRTAAMAAATAESALASLCRGMTCGSVRPAGASNVSLSRARRKNCDAVRELWLLKAPSVMPLHSGHHGSHRDVPPFIVLQKHTHALQSGHVQCRLRVMA